MKLKDFDFFIGKKESFIDEIDSYRNDFVKNIIVTPNLDFWVRMQSDKNFCEVIKSATYKVCDGMPLVWVSHLRWLLYDEVKFDRITGADLLPEIIHHAGKTGQSYRIAFIGGLPGVAEKAKDNLLSEIENRQNIDIKCFCPPFGFEKNITDTKKIIDFVNEIKPHYLFFGVGSPKQEIWLSRHKEELEFSNGLCVGAAFDFVAGTVKRSPTLLQIVGLEWCWRLFQEPKRLFRRYAKNFIMLIPLLMVNLKR